VEQLRAILYGMLGLAQEKRKVIVGMSGGVDSSVAVALLKQEGYEVTGVFMKNWADPRYPCPWQEDRQDAMRVAAILDIPFETWDFSKEYRESVVEYMIREYRMGRTPNPDVMCNSRIKFGAFLQYALKAGADFIATGHYVRLMRKSQTNSKSKIRNSKLVVAKDLNKDQSYFLWTLTQEQLAHSLFPIGDYTKPEVRGLAKKFGLPTADKPDSQGICFIGPIDVKKFLKTVITQKKGKIVNLEGKAMGEHEGAWFYTIGQRRIEGLSGTVKPMYVIGKDVKKNQVIVGDDKDTYAKIARLSSFHLINNKTVKPADLMGIILTAKSRYTPETSRGKLGKDKKGYFFEFVKPERAITPGQSLVLYKGDICLGGGIITGAK